MFLYSAEKLESPNVQATIEARVSLNGIDIAHGLNALQMPVVNYTATAQMNRNAPVRLFAVLALLSRYPFGLLLNSARFRVG